MKYILLTVFLLSVPAIAQDEEVVEEPAKAKVLTAEEQCEAFQKEVEQLNKKIAALEKDNMNLKNTLLRVSRQANEVRRLAVQNNSAASKVLDALERFDGR